MTRVINPFIFVGGGSGGPDGEVFWYRGATGVTDNGTDGNGHDGTYQGDMTTVSDDGKLAYLLDGTGDYMTLPSITMTGARTLSIWIKKDAGEVGHRRFFQFGSNRFSLYVANTTGQTNAYYQGFLIASMGTLSDDTWYHYTFEHDGVNTFTVYQDDSLVGTNSSATAAGFTELGYIGSTVSGGQPWKGRLDDIRGYDRKITDLERTDLAAGRA